MSRQESGPHLPERIEALQARQRQLLERLDAGEQRFRTLARSVWRVQEEERRRIARELHDGLGQNLTALKHGLALIGARVGDDPLLRQQVDSALALCSRTLQDTRELSRLLRPQILDDLGLEAALGWLVRTLGKEGGPAIALEYRLAAEPATELRTLVFRIVQEALTNVLRHAAADNAVVRVRERTGAVEVLVWDDGRGCEPAAAFGKGSIGDSAGLSGMRERVAVHGGELSLESRPGGGSRLLCVLPVQEPATQPSQPPVDGQPR